ncbi:hypothetical protein ACFL3D_02560 [Candidatus Omnitrophota bacterium]
MTKREKFIGICMLSIILVWLFMFLTKDEDTKKPITTAVKKIRKNTSQARGKKEKEALDLKKIKENIESKLRSQKYTEMRSPFTKIERAKKPKAFDVSQLSLMGVFFEQGVPFAVINEMVLREGDAVGECTVENIEQNRVIILHNAERIILTLHADIKKEEV